MDVANITWAEHHHRFQYLREPQLNSVYIMNYQVIPIILK